ncbi:MAG TPA: hypothetical protein PK402_09030, partial [Tepidisphaeraceae bacterium]|nr:hypothetical protein [Tepidisphaeraceae bacterium]
MPSLDRLTPQTLRSRIWRPRCRYRATARWLTKFVSISLLCLSVLALVGYRLLTDPDLLRQKTIAYLERATGGDVTISRAQISLINGIEFGDVSIRPHGSTQPIFLARSLRMTSTIWTLLTRPLSETKILASEAELFLVEDTDTDQLNILQLGRSMASRDLPGDQPSTSKSLPALPQLTLRGFKLHRLQITDGKTKPLDTLAIEGQFAPQPGTGNYRYHVTTRVGPGERGPSLSGEIGIEQGRFTAKIENVELAQARLFWMQRIRSFWDRFEPSGEIGAEISIFRKPDGESGFDVTLALKDAKLKLDPDDWIGPSSGEIDPSNDLAPIWLSKVQAIFAFHDDYIEIRGLTGLLDTTTVELNAKVDGYGFDAPLTASIRTRGEPIALRISEEQAARLPDFVKNLYNMFRPQGECHIEANVWRDIAGGRIDAVGSANFINTQFTFVNFPYPVHDAKGTLRLALDEPTGERQLLLERITGRGPSDSVNANAAVHIDGIMAPLAEGSGINITIKGQNTRGDELLMKCLPEGAQQVIAQFAPLGDEKFIHCLGDFETRVIRPRGHHVRWSFDTDIYLKEGRGIFKPLNVDIETAQANIFVRSGFVDFKDVITTSHGAQAKLDGRCLFDDPDDPEHRVITRINF